MSQKSLRELRNIDKNEAIQEVSQDGLILKYLDTTLKQDTNVVLTAILQNPEAMQFAYPSLKKSEEILRLIPKWDDNLVQILKHMTVKLNSEIAQDILTSPSVLKPSEVTDFINPYVLEDEDFWADVIEDRPSIYEDDNFKYIRKEYYITYTWVRHTPNLENKLHFIDKKFKKDSELVLDLADRIPLEIINWVDSSLLKNQEIVQTLLENTNNNPALIQRLSPEMKALVKPILEEKREETKTYLSYLFRHNISKIAVNQYNGNKKYVLALFQLYAFIVDIRNTQSDVDLSLKGNTFETWRMIILDHSKHFTPDESVVKQISESLRIIDSYYNNLKDDLSFSELIENKTNLYRSSRYKDLIHNLVSYVISFFQSLGIKVKPLTVVSEKSGIKMIAFTSDNSEESTIKEQLSLLEAVKNKLIKEYLSKNKIDLNTYTLLEENGIEYYTNKKGYFSTDTIKLYDSKEDLFNDVVKTKTIDKNYEKLVLSEGKIINPNTNKVIKKIEYLDPETLDISIQNYQYKLDEYNSNLKSYETPLNNDPKIIQVGDHSFKVVKVLDKNISRLVVIEGVYKGHFVDELVSSTGEVIGSASKASPYLTETSRAMENIDSYKKVKKVFEDSPVIKSSIQAIKDIPPSAELLEEIKKDKYYVKSVKQMKSVLSLDELTKITGLNLSYGLNPREIQISLYAEDLNEISHMVEIPSLGFELSREIAILDNGAPHHIHNGGFITHECLPDGFGSRVFVQQVKTASEIGFKYIDTLAGKSSEMVGYYVWPKLGYSTGIYLDVLAEKIDEYSNDKIKFDILLRWLDKQGLLNKERFVELSAIYACKIKDRFIGQELWYGYGDQLTMKFDLTPGSLSMRILENYVNLKAKKDNIDPKDFLRLEYSKFDTLNLECLLEGIKEKPIFTIDLLKKLKKAIIHNTKNYENNVLFRIYNSDLRVALLEALKQIKKYSEDVYNDAVYAIQRKQPNLKLASLQSSEDPILKELDMDILDQIWDKISREFK